MLGDQEPRDHKEDIDTDIAAGDSRQSGVERNDGKNGDGAQPLDVGSKVGASTAAIVPLWCRRVPGHGSYGLMLRRGAGAGRLFPQIPHHHT